VNDLQIIECEQNSPEWHQARAGIVTASNFACLLMKGRSGGVSETRRKYLYDLAGERLTGQSSEGWGGNKHTERGHALEPDARKLYAFTSDNKPMPVGFMKRGNVGASPDSLVGNDGLLEIKTKLPRLQLELLEANAVPDEHMAQLQGQLWVSGRAFVDFVSYWPGLPLFVKRVHRDEDFIAKLAGAVAAFEDELQGLVARFSTMQEAA
jgi:hypothetical protein